MQTDATSVNNSQHCWVLLARWLHSHMNVASVCMGLNVGPVSNYTQQVPTSANIVVVPCKRTQQVTTLLGPTMLGVVGQQCCVRLHGPKRLAGLKLYATSATIVVVPYKWTQQVTTLLGPTMLGVDIDQKCWVRLHGP